MTLSRLSTLLYVLITVLGNFYAIFDALTLSSSSTTMTKFLILSAIIFVQFYMMISIFQSLIKYTESLEKLEERAHLVDDEEKSSSKKKGSEKNKEAEEVAQPSLSKAEPKKEKKSFWGKSKKSKKEAEPAPVE